MMISQIKIRIMANDDVNPELIGAFVLPINGQSIDSKGIIGRLSRMVTSEDCGTIGTIGTGEARMTDCCIPGVNRLIYVVSPQGDDSIQLLGECYLNSLRHAAERGVRSVAFADIAGNETRYTDREIAEVVARSVLDFDMKDDDFDLFFYFQDTARRLLFGIAVDRVISELACQT
jgi:O-acetyl-ADP-ribose deacetylase (regulator of RNase III)